MDQNETGEMQKSTQTIGRSSRQVPEGVESVAKQERRGKNDETEGRRWGKATSVGADSG